MTNVVHLAAAQTRTLGGKTQAFQELFEVANAAHCGALQPSSASPS